MLDKIVWQSDKKPFPNFFFLSSSFLILFAGLGLPSWPSFSFFSTFFDGSFYFPLTKVVIDLSIKSTSLIQQCPPPSSKLFS